MTKTLPIRTLLYFCELYATTYFITNFNGLQNTVISKQSTARDKDVLIEATSLDHICNERNISSKMLLSFNHFNHVCFVFAWKRRLVFNKLTPVFHTSVLLSIMNFVITWSKPLWVRKLLQQCMTKFIVHDRTDA